MLFAVLTKVYLQNVQVPMILQCGMTSVTAKVSPRANHYCKTLAQ